MVRLLKDQGMKATIRVDKLLVNGEDWSLAKAQEYIDEPPEARDKEENDPIRRNPSQKHKKKESSSSPSLKPASQKPRNQISPLKNNLSKTKESTQKKTFTVPGPRVPKLNAPFVTTPQKNIQYTTIIADQ